MYTRQILPLWIVVSVFAASAVAVPLAGRLLRPSVPPPRTLAELMQSVGQRRPSFHVVPVMIHSPEAGLYFCERPQSVQQLMLLPRTAEYAGCWRGVVFCECVGRFSEIPPEELQSWGEHVMRIGPLLFFGDPNLLRRIHQEILAQERG